MLIVFVMNRGGVDLASCWLLFDESSNYVVWRRDMVDAPAVDFERCVRAVVMAVAFFIEMPVFPPHYTSIGGE